MRRVLQTWSEALLDQALAEEVVLLEVAGCASGLRGRSVDLVGKASGSPSGGRLPSGLLRWFGGSVCRAA